MLNLTALKNLVLKTGRSTNDLPWVSPESEWSKIYQSFIPPSIFFFQFFDWADTPQRQNKTKQNHPTKKKKNTPPKVPKPNQTTTTTKPPKNHTHQNNTENTKAKNPAQASGEETSAPFRNSLILSNLPVGKARKFSLDGASLSGLIYH